jgi:hypothetical protein
MNRVDNELSIDLKEVILEYKQSVKDSAWVISLKEAHKPKLVPSDNCSKTKDSFLKSLACHFVLIM